MIVLKIPPKIRKELYKLAIGSLTLLIFILPLLFSTEAKLGIIIFMLLSFATTANIVFVIVKISTIYNTYREEENKLLAALKDFFEKRGVKF